MIDTLVVYPSLTLGFCLCLARPRRPAVLVKRLGAQILSATTALLLSSQLGTPRLCPDIVCCFARLPVVEEVPRVCPA